MKRLIIVVLSAVIVIAGYGSAHAFGSYLTAAGTGFNALYPAAGAISNCALCHTNPNGGGARNVYGTAYANNGHSYTAIETMDSDGDGFTNRTEITSNPPTYPGDAASHPPLTVACTSFTFSAWSDCQPNNTQMRSVTSSSPAGCTGAPPSSQLVQACTYVPPVAACTSFTYSAWSACQSDNTQNRTVTSSSPSGCSGMPPASQLTQACTYVPPVNACTSFTYSAWSECRSDNTQNRTVTSSSPSGCSGTPPASQLTQACTYVPPTTHPTGDTSVTMNSAGGHGQMKIETMTGGTGLTNVAVLSDTDTSINQHDKPSGFEFKDGIVSFKLNGVAVGGTTQVKITFPGTFPAGSKVFKVMQDGFHEYGHASISGNFVTLTLTDGGSGDRDGIANGVIDDPVGVASPVSQSQTADTGGGGGGCSISGRTDTTTALTDAAILFMPLIVLAAMKGIRRRKEAVRT